MTREVGSDHDDGPEGRPARTGGEDAPGGDTALRELARFSGHGLTIAVAMGIFLMAGWWVDGRLGTTPLLTIIGALLGAGAGFYSMLQHLVFFPRQRAEDREARDSEDGAPGDEGSAPGDEGSRDGRS